MCKRLSVTQKKETETFLTPISVIGVVVPRKAASDQEFKLVTPSGVEYLILADAEWTRVLSTFRWEEVKVRGLLDPSAMTIVPQWVIPFGPTGETQRVSDKESRPDFGVVNKIKKTVADLVLVPCFA